MEKSIITHDTKGDVKHLEGREVYWLQTPESTGGSYSSVCCTIYHPGGRAKPAHSHAKGEGNGIYRFRDRKSQDWR